MELIAYVFPGWQPRLRPAAARRDWIEASPEAFAYRCLPLKMANEHGCEFLSPCGFSAEWNGGPLAGDVAITVDAGTSELDSPVALFGQATQFGQGAMPAGKSRWRSADARPRLRDRR